MYRLFPPSNVTARFRRARGESGVALVEAAIVIPLLSMLAFGALEFGLLYSAAIDLKAASRAGARIGTATGEEPTTDKVILQAIRNSRGDMRENGFERIVIYNASHPSLGPTREPHDTCQAGIASATWECNVYSSANFTSSDLMLELLESSYPSSTRSVGNDSLGIWIQARHPLITGFFGLSAPLKDQIIMRLEPAGTPSNEDELEPAPAPPPPEEEEEDDSTTTTTAPPPTNYTVPPSGDGNT